MTPTEKLTMRSTSFDSIEKENIAARLILNTPAIAVVKSIEISVE
ncbi:hypothetical protein RF679_14890 [Undibacterium cyanobacteriorum]|uniref:Uncharacterized protein n=1 Tax=Undibacterium cyanobacteriorum TaxID=3073561 RepID=A0ABY9RN05_9BURK|nr:hypothetical protein [Undibacterium sp. 20NA77.5]WMW82596.1 hypothetical protein RF679_14890 [Undibacterium sp. 20NA77.5]